MADHPKKLNPNQSAPPLAIRDLQPSGLNVIRPGMSPVNHLNPPQQQYPGGAVPGGEPVVKAQFAEDEISTFFRNRRMIAQGSFGMNPFVKVFIAVFIILLIFNILWNVSPIVRNRAQELSKEFLQLNLAEYVPAWTKKSIHFKKRSLTQFGSGISQGSGAFQTVSNGKSLDAMSLAVYDGRWPLVESFVASKCPKWTMSHECSVRAWYLAYRGMRSSLKPVQSLGQPQVPLAKRDQVFFSFAKSLLLDGSVADQMFADVVRSSSGDPELQKAIFEARFKLFLRENRSAEILKMIKLLPSLQVSAEDLEKWRVMETSQRLALQKVSMNSESRRNGIKFVGESVQKLNVVFKQDPLGFLIVAPSALKLGFSKQILNIGQEIVGDLNFPHLDGSIRRDAILMFARSLMMEGQVVHASEVLQAFQKTSGSDALTSHLLGSINLSIRTHEKMVDASALFNAAYLARGYWQSQYGYFLSLVRLGRLNEASKLVVQLEQQKAKASNVWISSALGEYKLASSKKSGDISRTHFKEMSVQFAKVYSQYPNWQSVANVYADMLEGAGQYAEAGKIRSQMDDLNSRSTYSNSIEFLESPLGPFGLMK